MEIFIIRHGEFDPSKLDPDPALNKQGMLQAKLVAKRLSKIKFDKIYCSDMKRSLETLKQVRSYQRCPVIILSELREVASEVNGAKRRSFAKRRKVLKEKFKLNKIFKRIIRENLKDSKILIISHANVINFFLSKFLGVSCKHFWKIMVWPTALTIVETNKKNYIIKLIGDTSHMKEHQFKMQPHLDPEGNHINR